MTTPIDPSRPAQQAPENPLRLWAFHYTNSRCDSLTGRPEILVRASEDKSWVDQKRTNCGHHKHLTATDVQGYVRADAHEETVAALAKAEARVAALTEAINAMVEVSQNDMDTHQMVYGIAHDALKQCAACFPTDGRPARPLSPRCDPAPVKSLPVIQTWGLACNNEHENAHCPFLETADEESTAQSLADKGHCTKFDRALTVDPTMDIGLWVRCSLCLQEVP